MATTIRNNETLKRLEKLVKENGNRTKTGVIDHIVEIFPFLESELKTAKAKIDKLEQELYQIKRIVRDKNRIDQQYNELCQKLEVE